MSCFSLQPAGVRKVFFKLRVAVDLRTSSLSLRKHTDALYICICYSFLIRPLRCLLPEGYSTRTITELLTSPRRQSIFGRTGATERHKWIFIRGTIKQYNSSAFSVSSVYYICCDISIIVYVNIEGCFLKCVKHIHRNVILCFLAHVPLLPQF